MTLQTISTVITLAGFVLGFLAAVAAGLMLLHDLQATRASIRR